MAELIGQGADFKLCEKARVGRELLALFGTLPAQLGTGQQLARHVHRDPCRVKASV